MRFAKYHGLGNDFLVVDLRELRGDDAAAVQDPPVVRAILDRQFGVGGDGVLAVLPGEPGADARMRVLNADGSEAEMCGNGIRCVAKELFDRGGVTKDRIAIDTGAGRLVCAITARNGRAETVTVEMGAPRLTYAEIPMLPPSSTGSPSDRCIEQPLEIAAHPPRLFTAVSMGNPHAVTFVEADEPRKLATSIGPMIENHPRFPRRTNTEFAHVISPTEIDLVVWERGSGLTLACGTGACATVVAAVLTGRAQEGREVTVHLPGGDLGITVLPGMTNVHMRGPALHVFDGELSPRQVAPRP
jgi:diaminopimelate epimerase